MRKVLITGITGFLGSHIAEKLLSMDFTIVGLKRPESDMWRCKEFQEQVEWIDIDPAGKYHESILNSDCDTIIHGAWIGVEAREREDWQQQSKNISFLISLLELAKGAGIKKIIFLGSQAEYGYINGEIAEDHLCEALNAYGGIKLACLEILKSFCNANQIDWIWLRIFSIFGERENNNWLIPSLVKKINEGGSMDLTAGEQKYAYLYVKDFSELVFNIVNTPIDPGIYNISSPQSRSIRSLIEEIRDFINPTFQLNFGALKYRPGKSMHMQGDMRKLTSQIGEVTFTDFSVALHNTLTYYINN
jgi:UDP-glucose 4-epimerase